MVAQQQPDCSQQEKRQQRNPGPVAPDVEQKSREHDCAEHNKLDICERRHGSLIAPSRGSEKRLAGLSSYLASTCRPNQTRPSRFSRQHLQPKWLSSMSTPESWRKISSAPPPLKSP